MAVTNFGGVMKMRTSTGKNISLRGTFSLSPSRVSVEAMSNQDASLDRIFTPKPRTCEIVFADKGVDLAVIMEDEVQNVSIIEDHTGVTHNLTGAFMTGDPVINRLTGEVTGVSLAFENYDRIGGR
jgi:hypothetical protein